MLIKCDVRLVGLVLLASVGIGATTLPAPLADAARRGDREAVRTLLQKAPDVNQAGPDGTTALHWAVQHDDRQMVEMLLRAGADVKPANRYGVTSLSVAAVNGNPAIIDLLLKAGADPNTAMPEGETALMTVARAGKADALKLLIDKGADVNSRDTFRGQTALMWAAARNNVEAIRLLINAGADAVARTNNPTKSTGRMSESGNTFSSPAPTGFTPILFAVQAGNIDAARELLQAGADINDTLSDGESTLVVATANAHWQLADFLLDHGANPNLAGAGWNALHQAVRERRPNIGFGTPGPIPTGTLDSIHVIKKMIAKGVSLNARMSKNGMKDGQRNRLNRLGATAFFLAAKNTDTEVMRVLAAAGADAAIRSADGTTPLMVAAGLAIWNPGEDGGSLAGQEDEVLEAVKICVELGNDVNAANMYGETALQGAAFRGVSTVVEYLAEKGARLDAKDMRGWTALAIANGLTYIDFFKQQVEAADVLKRLMTARGLPTEGHAIDAKVCLDCLQTRTDQARDVVERDRRMEAEFAKQLSTQGSK